MHRAIVIDIRTGERIDVIENTDEDVCEVTAMIAATIGLEYVVVYCDYDPGVIS